MPEDLKDDELPMNTDMSEPVTDGPDITEEDTLKPKTLGTSCQNGCRDAVPDVVIVGEDLFKLLSKASSQSEGWMKSTKGMATASGVVVQVTTQQRNEDGSYAVAEALTFVPGASIITRGDAHFIK